MAISQAIALEALLFETRPHSKTLAVFMQPPEFREKDEPLYSKEKNSSRLLAFARIFEGSGHLLGKMNANNAEGHAHFLQNPNSSEVPFLIKKGECLTVLHKNIPNLMQLPRDVIREYLKNLAYKGEYHALLQLTKDNDSLKSCREFL